MFQSNQKGSTMIEALSALMIITVLGIAGIKLVGSIFDMFRQNIVSNEIKDIQKNVAARYSADGDYLGLKDMTTANLLAEKMVPNQMVANGKIYHRLGGEVLINQSTLGELYFDVTFKDLSSRSCMNLSQINWVTNQNSDLVELVINDKTFKLPFGEVSPGDGDALPMTVAKATTACKSGADNNITWTFQ